VSKEASGFNLLFVRLRIPIPPSERRIIFYWGCFGSLRRMETAETVTIPEEGQSYSGISDLAFGRRAGTVLDPDGFVNALS
jgi:hypothetical protein